MISMKHKHGAWLSLLFVGALTAGCEQSQSAKPEPADLSPGADGTILVSPEEVMVAKVDTSDGGYIAWYEPIPGLIVVGEMGKYPNPPVANQLQTGGVSPSPEELYRALAPDRPVPATLSQAIERRSYYATLSASLGVSSSAEVQVEQQPSEDTDLAVARQAVQDPNPDDSACPYSWFNQYQCGCIGGAWCNVWGYQTGTTSFTYYDQNIFRSSACAYRGTVRYIGSYKTWWSWTRGVDVQVPAGWYANWWHDNSLFDFAASSWVQEAEGDGYHHCGSGGW